MCFNIGKDAKSLFEKLKDKDVQTYIHCQSTATLAVKIAEVYREKFGKSLEIEEVFFAGLFHDYGKLSFANDLINGTLIISNPKDNHEILRHPQVGVTMLSSVIHSKSVLDGIKHHHERLDGSGYPYGLKGDDIPIIAKIISVADTFDAMTTPRGYKRTLSRNQAISILEKENHLFDKNIVSILKLSS